MSTTRIFRICQHIIPMFFTLLIALLMMKGQTGASSPYGILMCLVISFFTTTYFLSYHGDKAEGLAVSIYVE